MLEGHEELLDLKGGELKGVATYYYDDGVGCAFC
jgi:hypothetical protein